VELQVAVTTWFHGLLTFLTGDPRGSQTQARQAALAAVLLFALLGVLHYDVIFQGRSLVLTNQHNPVDYRYDLPQNYGDAFVSVHTWLERNLSPYANIRDPGGSWWQWQPSGEFLERAMKTGEWPFWDPYVGGGAPAMTNLTPAFFFPPYALMVAIDHSVSTENLYLLLLVWGTSFFAYLFVRAHSVNFAASLVGAAALMLGGAVNQHVGTIMGQTAACLTLVLYVTRLFFDQPTWFRAMVLALTYASAALASFPPVLLAVFGLAAFYAILSIVAREIGPATRLHAGVRWLAAVLVAVGLVAFYYLPAVELWRTFSPTVAAVYAEAGREAIPVRKAYQLLSPTLAGGVNVYQVPPIPTADGPHIPYVGVGVLVAAALAAPAQGRRRLLFIFSVSAGVAIALKLFGMPPAQWVGYLPVLERIHFAHYFGIPLGFMLAFLAALGIDQLLRGSRSLSVVRAVGAATLAVAVAGTLFLLADSDGTLKTSSGVYWLRDWSLLLAFTLAMGFALISYATCRRSTAAGRVLAGVAIAVIVGEGLHNSSYPSPAAWDIFDHPVPYIQVLRQKAVAGRVFTFAAPNANLNSAYEIYTFDSLMPFNPPRALELYRRYTSAPRSILMRHARNVPPEPTLDIANIAVISVRNDFPDIVRAIAARGHPKIFDDGYVTLFERQTLPKYFFSSEYRVLPTSVALEAIAEARPRELVLEDEPGVPSTPNIGSDPSVRVDAVRPNSVTLLVDAPRPGLVYASESFLDGWSARVNGVETRILPANYAFRAIPVPQGAARIELRYWPPGLTLGLIVTGASAVGLLALMTAPFLIRRLRQGRRPS
jgi:hypothetical protein